MLAFFTRTDYAVLFAYLAAMVVLGAWFSRREKTTDDFFRGGGRVPWWAAGLSIFGTGLSAITFLAVPVSSYAGDWTRILFSIAPIFLVPIIAAVFVPFYRRLDVTTPYEYLEKRFNTAARLVASGQWMLFQIFRMSINVYLPALALSAVTGMQVYECILLIGVMATIYTILGGIEAVIWTDVVQVIVLVGGAVACLLFIFAKVEGGFAFIVADGVRAGKFAVSHSTNSSWSSLLLLAFGSAVTNFNVYATDQQLVQRYMSTPSVRQAKAALWTSAIGGIPIAFLFFMIGTSLWAFYSQNPAIAPDNKVVFAEFIARQLPTGMAGLLVAGLFAASMSTIDSGVNSICAAATTDFVRRFGLVSERNMLMFARILTLVVGTAGTGAAVAMSFHNIESMYDFFIRVLGLFGGPLAGMFVLGIFTRRCGSLGALSGAGVSAAIMLFIFFNPKILPVDDMLMGLLGLVICVITGYAVGLLTGRGKQPPRGLTIYSRDDGSTTALSEPCAAEINRRA